MSPEIRDLIRRRMSLPNPLWGAPRIHGELPEGRAPHRLIERIGDVVAHPILGGLHHRYARI
jgi:hypothetical protein